MDFLQLKKADVHLKRWVPLYRCYKHTILTVSKNTDGKKKTTGILLFLTLTLWTTHSSLHSNCHASFYSQESQLSFLLVYYYFKQHSKGDKTHEIAFIRTQQNWQCDPESDAVSETTMKLIFLKMTRFWIVNIPLKCYFLPVLINTCYKGTKKALHCKLMSQ